ncbi:MAG: DUF4157 domain-containing protein, partial [Nodosilinea sp.]
QSPLQTKLNSSTSGDAAEQEADRMAETVMRQPASPPAVPSAGPEDGVLAQSQGLYGGGGHPLSPDLRHFFESRFGQDLGQVRIHTDATAAASAQALNARAFTLGKNVVFGPQQYAPQTTVGRRLIAHELTHVLQQQQSAAPAVIQRDPRPPSPRDAALVRRARARLAVIEPLLTQLRVQSTRTVQDRLDTLRQREALDANSADLGPPGQRQQMEEANLGQLNQHPLRIEVSASTVTFRVNFQVKFQDSTMGDEQYQTLITNMQAGIAQVWNHQLSGDAFGGRRFWLIPTFTRVAVDAARDLNYWLVVVRSQDLGVATYPGCTLDATDPAVPTSVTSSTCDGGVMVIPPRHLSRSSILGHETLHLFGLVDRYMSLTSVLPGQAPVVENDPTRETGGRPDPLGTESGTILREDLGFLFVHLGVYDQELTRLHANMATLEGEIHRLREIVRLGRDPNSLIDSVIRRDFNDRLIRSAEDL